MVYTVVGRKGYMEYTVVTEGMIFGTLYFWRHQPVRIMVFQAGILNVYTVKNPGNIRITQKTKIKIVRFLIQSFACLLYGKLCSCYVMVWSQNEPV
jgi:hypothetical protein